jgi:site-specific recombinase XerD
VSEKVQGQEVPPATITPVLDALQPSPPSNRVQPGQRLQADGGEGCSLLSIDELRAMRGLHDPTLRGTDLARYAEWDGTALAVREIVSTVAYYLEVGGTPWNMTNTRHWTAWVFFATSRDLDPRTDASDLMLMAFALAMLENGYAGKTVRNYLRSIVRMVYGIGPETKTSATAAGPANALTAAWAREGREKHRKRPPVLPLGHILALAEHLRDAGDVEGWWFVAASYARALRPIETLRFDPATVEVHDDVLSGHIVRTKKSPGAGEVVQVPRLRDGWGDGTALDAGAAWAALVEQQGGEVRSSAKRLSVRVQQAAEAAGLPEWAARTPRRSRTTHMLLSGSSVETLMWLLRHESRLTTDRYVDALWAYGYDTTRSAQVLLDQRPPTTADPNLDGVGLGANPQRALAAVAASPATTENLQTRAVELVTRHETTRRGNLAAETVREARRSLERANEWCVEMLGRELDLDDPSADVILAHYSTALLEGKSKFSSAPRAVERQMAGVFLHARPEVSFWRTRQVVAGALRTDERKPTQPEAATVDDVIARLITNFTGPAKQQVAQARSNVAHALMWGSAGRISDICEVRLSTMFSVPGLGTVALLGTSKGGRGAPCPRDVLLIPDRDDELDLRRHLERLLELREKHGVTSDWLMGPADRASDRPPIARQVRRRIAKHAAVSGLPPLRTRAYRLGRTKELAEDGATQPELQRWLRHATGDLVSTYTRQADPSWLWKSALRFVEEGR